MTRRSLLLCGVALMLSGFARADGLPLRRAKFEEVGDAVLMSVVVADLLPRRDRDALASIDSGFATTFVLRVWLQEYRTQRVIDSVRRVVKLQYDLWQHRYVLVVTDEGRGSAKRYFATREAAIAAAVSLERLRIGRVSQMQRGRGPYYFAAVVCERNPIASSPELESQPETGQAGARDLRWFGRVVEFLAGERPVAEHVVAFRTNPFYLVPR